MAVKVIQGVVGVAVLWLVVAYAFGPIGSEAPPAPLHQAGLSAANRPDMPAGGWPRACLDRTATTMEDALKPRPDPRDTVECRRALADLRTR